VSCVSAAFCVLGTPAGAISVWNGVRWTKLVRVDNVQQWVTVSCATTSFCMAGDANGNVATYNGKTWSRLHGIGLPVGGQRDSVYSLSCPSPRFCAAGLDEGTATFNGKTWTYAPKSDDPGLFWVSCTSASFCAALGFTDSGQGLPAAWTFDGRQWSSWVRVFNDWPLEIPTDVSCATPKFCMAIDASGLAQAGTG
jgi:hypothetical protein